MLHVFGFIVFIITCVRAIDDFEEIIMETNYSYWDTLEKIFEEKNGTLLYGDNILILKCMGRFNLLTDVFPRFKKTITVNKISIEDCSLPIAPLVDVFREININVTAIEKLRISVMYTELLPPGNFTLGLNIKMLSIYAPYSDHRNFLFYNPDFMKSLTNVTTLMLGGLELPTLPPEMSVELLALSEYVHVPTWNRYCQNLRKLSIRRVNLEDIPLNWPKNCSQLTDLRLKGLYVRVAERILQSGINESCTNLQSLYVQSCYLDTLPFEILNVVKDLKHLNLSHNRFTDKDLTDFPMIQNLTHLDLSRNQLTGWIVFDLVKQVPALQYLNLDENNFVNLFCNYETRMNSFTSNLLELQTLSLKGMPMKVDCLENVQFSKLEYLNMASSGIIHILKLQKLPMTNATRFEIDLRGRPINLFSLYRVDYEALAQGNLTKFWGSEYNYKNKNLTVLLTSVNCDCENYWLALALRNLTNFVSMPGLLCENTGVEIIKEPFENTDCSKFKKEFGCIRRSSPTEDSYVDLRKITRVECHNSKTEILEYPIYPNDKAHTTISLNVTDNRIESLDKIKILDTMQWIDLRRNRISRLDANDTSRLFENRKRRVWLSQNLFVCDCDNSVMIDAFHRHHDQIDDFDELTCIDSGKNLNIVSTYEICQYGLRTALAISGVITALVLITALLLWHYRYHVKIYLFSRGWCLFYLTEDDVDADRPYDAFLSFSHGDIRYITEDLLPKLEGEPNLYRICVHYRDWVVGDWIPAQIMRSVSLSKRTIIVLSRSFVESMWGSLEFRYAVASAAQESRSRLLVLVLDDVLSEELNMELRGYLSYNTYLRCDDPWFWEKLRYAMPRRKRLPEKQLPLTKKRDVILMDNIISSSERFNSNF